MFAEMYTEMHTCSSRGRAFGPAWERAEEVGVAWGRVNAASRVRVHLHRRGLNSKRDEWENDLSFIPLLVSAAAVTPLGAAFDSRALRLLQLLDLIQ